MYGVGHLEKSLDTYALSNAHRSLDEVANLLTAYYSTDDMREQSNMHSLVHRGIRKHLAVGHEDATPPATLFIPN